ncbi:hypothetical protein Y000_00275 [Staphylococcus aureus MUF168]|nr:hypothetical protein Y000_00275 [Staphylococcus aureus MUF168]
MSSASFNSILALFCRIFKYKFGMNNKMVFKLSCVVGIKDINQSNRHYNAYWRGPTKRNSKSQLTIMCKLGMGPNKENFEKKFYKQCKLGKDNKFKIQGVILICYYYDNLQNYMKNE